MWLAMKLDDIVHENGCHLSRSKSICKQQKMIKWCITTKITVIEQDTGRPTIKSMDIDFQGLSGIYNSCNIADNFLHI